MLLLIIYTLCVDTKSFPEISKNVGFCKADAFIQDCVRCTLYAMGSEVFVDLVLKWFGNRISTIKEIENTKTFGSKTRFFNLSRCCQGLIQSN